MLACGPNYNLYVLAAIALIALTAVAWVLTAAVRLFTRLTAARPPETTGEPERGEVADSPTSTNRPAQ